MNHINDFLLIKLDLSPSKHPIIYYFSERLRCRLLNKHTISNELQLKNNITGLTYGEEF
jgi:hypothetical protein